MDPSTAGEAMEFNRQRMEAESHSYARAATDARQRTIEETLQSIERSLQALERAAGLRR